MLKINSFCKVESTCLPNETKDKMGCVEFVEVIPVDTNHLNTKGLGWWDTHIEIFPLLISVGLASVDSFKKNTWVIIHRVKKVTHVNTTLELQEKWLLVSCIDWCIFPIFIFIHDLIEGVWECDNLSIWNSMLSVLLFDIELNTFTSKSDHHINKFVPLNLTIFILIIFVEQSFNFGCWIVSCSLDLADIHHQISEFTSIHVAITVGIVMLETVDEQLSVWAWQQSLLLCGEYV